MRFRNVVGVPAAVAVMVAASAWSQARAEEGMTVAALKVALAREVESRQAYLAFAEQADEERVPQAAVLFRALAAAEAVHVRHHALALEPFGVTGVPASGPVAVGSTVENLRAALAGEEQESRVTYPRFMTYAQDECLYDARASLRYARDAEVTHVLRLSLLLMALEHGQPAAAAASGPAEVTYHVCNGCGAVRTQSPARHCSCGTSSAQCLAFTAPAFTPATEPALRVDAGRSAVQWMRTSRDVVVPMGVVTRTK